MDDDDLKKYYQQKKPKTSIYSDEKKHRPYWEKFYKRRNSIKENSIEIEI